MKTRSLIVVMTMIVFALLLSACGSTTIRQETPRTLSVSGNGQAFLDPDIAYIYVGVHTEKATAAEAVAENNTQTQEVIDALKKAGIAEKDIRTANFNIYPQDKFDPQSGAPTGTKVYVVDNTVNVTIRKLDQLGDLLDTVVKAGANAVNSVQFDVVNKADALKQARAEAVKNAEAQAKELADAAGLSLGPIQSISFIDNQPIVFDGKGGGGMAPVAASVPIQTGQLSFTVTVNVTYALK